jgi:hypothetical protein
MYLPKAIKERQGTYSGISLDDLQKICIDILTSQMSNISILFCIFPMLFIILTIEELGHNVQGEYTILYKDVPIWRGASGLVADVLLHMISTQSWCFYFGKNLAGICTLLTSIDLSGYIKCTPVNPSSGIADNYEETGTPDLKIISDKDYNGEQVWLPCLIRVDKHVCLQYSISTANSLIKVGDSKNQMHLLENFSNERSTVNTAALAVKEVVHSALAALGVVLNVFFDAGCEKQGDNTYFEICTKVCTHLAMGLYVDTMILTLPTILYVIKLVGGIEVMGETSWKLSNNVVIWPGLTNDAIKVLQMLINYKFLDVFFGAEVDSILNANSGGYYIIPNEVHRLDRMPTPEQLEQLSKDPGVYCLPCVLTLSTNTIFNILNKHKEVQKLRTVAIQRYQARYGLNKETKYVGKAISEPSQKMTLH